MGLVRAVSALEMVCLLLGWGPVMVQTGKGMACPTLRTYYHLSALHCTLLAHMRLRTILDSWGPCTYPLLGLAFGT